MVWDLLWDRDFNLCNCDLIFSRLFVCMCPTCLSVCSSSVALVVSCMAWLFPGLTVILRDSDETS